jgi:hypothetical protein
MRMLMMAVVCAAVLAGPAQAGRIETGQDLVRECSDYLGRGAAQDNNVARAPHPCRSFLQGFFVSLIERDNARRDALVKGLPYASKEKCVRLPDFLSYTDMAQRIMNYTKSNPQALSTPAATVAQQTLERDFPCPTTNNSR